MKKQCGWVLALTMCLSAQLSMAGGYPVFDNLNWLQNRVSAIKSGNIYNVGIEQLKAMGVKIEQGKKVLFQYNTTLGTKSWSPKVSKDFRNGIDSYGKDAAKEYKKYRETVESEYGKPWTTNQFSDKLGNTGVLSHYARMEREVQSIDSELRLLIYKVMPEIDQLTEDIKKTYEKVITNCHGDSSNKTECTAATRQQALVEIGYAQLQYMRSNTHMVMMIARMKMLVLRRELLVKRLTKTDSGGSDEKASTDSPTTPIY